MANRLEVLMAAPSWRRPGRGVARSAAVYTDRAAERIRSGPEQAKGRGNAARQAARKALLRALRPVTVYQRQVNEDILSAIEGVDETVQSVARGQADSSRRIDELEAQLRTLRERQD